MTGAGVRAVVASVGRTGLVNAIVGEMHETVAEVVDVVIVFDGGETREAVRIDVDLERIEASDEHVETQVELGAAYQQRSRQILLHDDGAFLWYLRPAVDHANPGAASGGRWLDDPLLLATVLLPHLAEETQVLR